MCELTWRINPILIGLSKIYSLGQVPACAGLLGTVRLGNAEGVSQGWDAGLQVQLGGLGEECLLPKVVQVEEGGASLHLGLH